MSAWRTPAILAAVEEAADIDAAIEAAKHAVANPGDLHPIDVAAGAWSRVLAHPTFKTAPAETRGMILTSFGAALAEEYRLEGEAEVATAMINAFEAALDAFPERSTDHAMAWANLALARSTRHEIAGEPADLAAALEGFGQALAELPRNALEHIAVLGNLGITLVGAWQSTANPAYLDRGIEVLRSAVVARPTNPVPRSELLSNLGVALMHRHELSGTPEDLEHAAAALETAVAEVPSGMPDGPMFAANAATVLFRFYEDTFDPSVLDRAVAVLQKAVALSPPGELRSGHLVWLGQLLHDRFGLRGDEDDLDAAIDAADEALTGLEEGSRSWGSALSRLAGMLRDRALTRSDITGLDQAERALRRALAVLTEPPEKPDTLNVLGVVLSDRYEIAHEADDLHNSIDAHRGALQSAPDDHPLRHQYLNNLGVALLMLFNDSGDLRTLTEALGVLQGAVDLTPRRSSDQLARNLDNLGGALVRYALLTGDHDSLRRAVHASEEAVVITPPTAVELAGRLNNLGDALRLLYLETDDTDALDRAVTTLESAVAATPPDSAFRSRHQRNLGHALLELYRRDGHEHSLAQAIETLRGASTDSEVGLVLAEALAERHRRHGQEKDCAAAQEAYRRTTVQELDRRPSKALEAAQAWGNWAFDRVAWEEAAEAFGYGMAAVQSLFATQVVRQHKEIWLNRAGPVATLGAYALARAGKPEAAAVVLEQGRGLMLGEALGGDAEGLIDLGHEELHHRFVQAAGRLRALGLRDLRAEQDPQAVLREASQAKAARDLLIEEIREVPGYEEFMRPATLDDLWEAATERPLVQIMVTSVGGMALIVRGEPVREVTPIWLPELTGDTAYEAISPYMRSLFREIDRQGVPPVPWSQALDKLARWLWDVVMEPILAALVGDDHATLVPCGALAILPLHAAWMEDPAMPSGRRYALDVMLLTYAPGARALVTARRRARSSNDRGMLAVGDPQPVSAPQLLGAAREVAAAMAGRPRALNLSAATATRDAVLDAVGDYSLLHLACHGRVDAHEPLASCLLLAHDEQVTVRDLLERRTISARLAVLSACETAMLGGPLPDEIVGMPAALIQAGAAGVIASQWRVFDISTMMLMIRFYEIWDETEMEPAEALRRAQQWLRDTTNEVKHGHFPDIPELDAQLVPEAALAFWKEAYGHRHPGHWASFTFTGV